MPAQKNSPYSFLIPFVIFFLLVFVIWQGLNIGQHKPEGETVNQRLPDMNLPILFTQNEHLTAATFHGQVVLLNFWATWCSACRKEHATLLAIRQKYNIPIYGILYNDKADNAKAWLGKFGDPYTAVAEDFGGSFAKSLDIYGIPETFVIDQNGLIRYRFLGAITEEAWEDVLLPVVKKYSQ